MSIGVRVLPAILLNAAPVFDAVGNMVKSFSSGLFRLPSLEKAWCDAAYWLHQALAESIDTIAIAKLETALEVLVSSQSSKGSKRRILEILDIFFDLGPDDPVVSSSHLKAREFAENIVSDRSRILHGTWSTLNARVADRAGMEGFVISVIRAFATEFDVYARSGDAVDSSYEFFDWIKVRKKSAASS